MSAYEYIIIMVSIILGLGITTLLKNIAALVKRSKLSSLFTPYLIWIILVLFLHLHGWWTGYALKLEEIWSPYKFMFVLLYPMNLYILAHLLFPTGVSGEFTSKEFYLAHYRKLFVGVIALDIQLILYNLIFSRLAIHTQVPHLLILIILSAIATAKTKNTIVHALVAVLLLIALLTNIVLEERTVY